MDSRTQAGWLIAAGVFFIIAGACYVLAALGVEPLAERLGDSVGGAWFQGLGAIAIGIGFIGFAGKVRKG